MTKEEAIYILRNTAFLAPSLEPIDEAIDMACEALKQADTTQREEIYPLTIVLDRYSGTYSGGYYTAWNMDSDEVPQEINADDVSCYDFWHSYEGVVGLGRTPNDAIEDLRQKLSRQTDRAWK